MYFGEFGGQYIPPMLTPVMNEIDENYKKLRKNNEFNNELNDLLKNYVGRPSPIYFCKKLSKKLGFKLYLKREDLNHTGAHKINNTLGQALIAKHMGKKEIIAETGAGQHGVATATAAALVGIKCKIFMGALDIKRQEMNVFRIKLLGSQVIPVTKGTQVLKDAVDAALEYLVKNPTVYFLVGSVVGPHPYPTMVRDFQSVIGREAKKQFKQINGKLPDFLVACAGGGSNAMGLFHEFLSDEVKMIAIEAGGQGIKTKKHAATMTLGKPGVIHGMNCLLLQDKGEPMEVYSIAPGLDYPGIGPEPSFLKTSKRIEAKVVTDKQALRAFDIMSREEGIIPALESSHALAYVFENKNRFRGKTVLLNLSGRGDKDVETVYGNFKS